MDNLIVSRYILDKVKHERTMEILMGISVLRAFEKSGGMLIDEFKKMVKCDNWLINYFSNGKFIEIKGDMLFLDKGFYGLVDRANKHFMENYGSVITVF
ncbi:MAG: hypothetical protein ACRCTZ_21165 [Sarcina sp.]